MTRAQMVERILKKLETAFATEKATKATLGDYIRLVQLRKELEDDEPREIRVMWVEREAEPETKSGSEG